MKYLAKFCADYADEFDVYGWKILTEEEKEKIQSVWRKYFENLAEQSAKARRVALNKHIESKSKYGFYFDDFTMEISFGTNEYLEFSSYDDINRCVDWIEITDEDAETITRSFGRNSFGMIYAFKTDTFSDNY